jgi:spore germination protein KA
MIRRLLRDPKLSRINLKVGLRAHNQCAILYIADLANPALIKEIRRRLESLEVDAVLSSGALEQLIQDSSWGIYPLSMSTERPDRVVASLLDGKAVVFLEGDPFALVYPSDVWSLLHAAEDPSSPGPGVTIIRFIRWLAAGMLLFLPGMYLAIVGFHPEMLPTDLLLSIAANRERVPFPSVIEVLLMELSFELIREAGVRIPGVIGPTLGIVGAIILGQAAVAANLVNPIVIVIVALTGISAFAIPSYSLTITLRVYRFLYIFLGSTLGLLGMAAGVTYQFIVVVSLKSMGAPYLAPLGPFTFSNKDILARGMLWNQERRQDYLGAQDKYRQAPISRKWILSPGGQGRKKQQ